MQPVPVPVPVSVMPVHTGQVVPVKGQPVAQPVSVQPVFAQPGHASVSGVVVASVQEPPPGRWLGGG